MARSSGAARERVRPPVADAAPAPTRPHASSSSNAEHAGAARAAVEGDDVAQRRQAVAHGEDLLQLRGGGDQHGHRAGVAQDVLGLSGGQGGVDRHIGAARGQAGVSR